MRIRFTLLLIAAFVGLACASALPGALASDPCLTVRAVQDEERDLPERDEIRKTVELQPGARVEVSAINGSVTAETSAGNVAEIYIVRSAKTREALQYRKILIDQGPGFLKVHGENEHGRTPDVRQRVVLKLPRSIDLTVRGVNGRVAVGPIDGMIHVSGINGAVDVAHAMSTSDISGINGSVRIALERLNTEGMTISGVNGRVELHFAEAINADISVTGINGSVVNKSGSITVIGKLTPSSFRGRIGEGGPTIQVSGVNGNVELLSEGPSER